MKLIINFGNIYLDYNNHIEVINNGTPKKNIIKIITYKELLLELSSFEDKTINYFINNGLSKNINQKANISLIVTSNRNKTKLETYDFSYKDENKNICYDIPYYHKNVPEGFSAFCTDEELELVIKHVSKKDYKPKIKDKKKEENITSEPEPSKKNFICQLCRSRFDNYKEHIISDTHLKNIKKHKNSFNKLSFTFKRIVNNNLNLSKTNSNSKSFSNHLSDDINDIFEFFHKEFKKINTKQSYNLRAKRSPSFGREENNYYTYFMSTSKNSNIKVVRNENDFCSPQQQVSSTASSTFKNILTLFDDVSDTNKNFISMKKKRRREEKDDFIYEQLNTKNKRIKI